MTRYKIIDIKISVKDILIKINNENKELKDWYINRNLGYSWTLTFEYKDGYVDILDEGDIIKEIFNLNIDLLNFMRDDRYGLIFTHKSFFNFKNLENDEVCLYCEMEMKK